MTQEDYLNNYQENLIEKLQTSFNSINRDILICFSLLFIFLLFRVNILEETSINGNKIKISQEQALLLFPLLIAVTYLLVNNSIQRIIIIIELLKSNSDTIIRLNPEARPFETGDLFYLTDGVSGLQLSLANLIVKYLLKRENFKYDIGLPTVRNIKEIVGFTILLPFKLYRVANHWVLDFLRLFMIIIVLVSIFLLPLIVPFLILFETKVEILLTNFNFPKSITDIHFIECLFLLLIILYTTLTNLFLYSYYFTKIKELKNEVLIKSYENLFEIFTRINQYYRNK